MKTEEKLVDKLIIHNYSCLGDTEVIKRVLKVVQSGKISKHADGKGYCFATKFADGAVVESVKRKDTYTFYVFWNGE